MFKIIKNHWKKIIIFLIILGISLLLITKVKAIKTKNGFTTTTVVRKDLSQIISASGRVKADEELTLKFQTSGQLTWVGVKKGDYVQKWQTIASLDLNELQKKLKQELIDYLNERWDLEQTRADYQDKSYDAATLETIRRTKDQAQFDMDRTVLDVEISDIALKYATLITPIEGIITKIDTPYAGVNVTPTTAEFVVSNPNKLVFGANVDETDIGKIKVGQTAKLTFDAYPDEYFEAPIEQIEFTPTLTSGGGTAYAVKFLLPPNPLEKFKLGMNGDAEILTSHKENILIIPTSALREENNEQFIWVLDNEKPVKKLVKTGLNNEEEVEILEGVGAGEQVITSGFKNLKE